MPNTPVSPLTNSALTPSADDRALNERARRIVEGLTLREKIGQKLIVAFRFWCPDSQPTCELGMTEFNAVIGDALHDNAIGGVILFTDNLQSLEQSRQLIGALRGVPPVAKTLGLLVGVDEEGGAIVRLPRSAATVFPGNMALGAAYEGCHDDMLAYEQGVVLAREVAALGFNLNFTPVVDVNSNPLNPVINVRAFGDDVPTISLLGRRTLQGMASQGVIGAFKHFPGHGNTATDTHLGLGVVNTSREEAYAIDLAPYRQAIEAGEAPEMIMTAHIQYPSLDSTLILTNTGEQIIAPATMSRKIQHDILRGELGFQGVTVTDAMDMKAIAHFFGQADATIKAFQADVDIAVMPTEFRSASEAHLLPELIDQVVAAVESGLIDRQELDLSVMRIVQLKLRNGISAEQSGPSQPDLSVIGCSAHRVVERSITEKSITLIRNECALLPLQSRCKQIFILTPVQEQAEAIRRRFVEAGYPVMQLNSACLENSSWADLKRAICAADTLILGTASTRVSAVVRNADPDKEGPHSDLQRIRFALEYAKTHGKAAIHLTMRSPYDVVSFDDLVDATLATYSFHGYDGGLRGPSLPVAVDVILGRQAPQGCLPVAIYAQGEEGELGPLRYARGFGLSYPMC